MDSEDYALDLCGRPDRLPDPDTPLISTLQLALGPCGRKLGRNRRRYFENNTSHVIYFNAQLITREHGRVWFGDLDLTREEDRLVRLAQDLRRVLLIFSNPDRHQHDPFHEDHNVAAAKPNLNSLELRECYGGYSYGVLRADHGSPRRRQVNGA